MTGGGRCANAEAAWVRVCVCVRVRERVCELERDAK